MVKASYSLSVTVSYDLVPVIRVFQVASVKQEWNAVKTFPDVSGTGLDLWGLMCMV